MMNRGKFLYLFFISYILFLLWKSFLIIYKENISLFHLFLSINCFFIKSFCYICTPNINSYFI